MTSRRWRILGAWAPPAAWAALIFAGSSLPGRAGRVLFPGADKVIHLVEFGILGFLLARALRITRPAWPLSRVLGAAAFCAAAFGATDEFHQSFVPDREMQWGDLAADAVGGLAGAALLAGLAAGRPRLSAPPPST